ncbi:LysR family transcriptional regulator [Metapseudomonas otitidis]|uniref:LysR family transcriptional regulator n=1 Tax=Metapseudomonas otitidis TaxID=319939 RepID=UPI003CF4A1FB
MISLRQLRYFVEIVDAGSLSRAAERLFIAQSALSRQLRELEDELDTELLLRGPRQVTLTEAGQAFLPRARRLLLDLEAASDLARQVGQGQHGSLRLGHSSSVPLIVPMQAALCSYLEAHPGVSLDLIQQSSEQQLADLREGRLDACLLRLPVLRQHPGLSLRPLYREPLLLAVAVDHPLARRDGPVPLADLREEAFVSIPHLQRGGLSYRAAELCLREGFFPRAARVVSRKTSQLHLIEAGLGVALVAASMSRIAPAGVRFLPLADPQADSEVALAWRSETRALDRGLVEHLCQHLASDPTTAD